MMTLVTRLRPLLVVARPVRVSTMHCLNCRGPLEYAGAQKEYARCTHCLALFNHDARRHLTPIVVEAPGGGNNPEFNATFAQQLGFAPRKATHEVMGANIGGLNVGVKVNTAKIERDVKNKISGIIWGWIIGGIILFLIVAVFAVVGLYVYFQAKDVTAGGGPAPAAAPGKATKWDGKSTFNCGGLDNVTIDGTTATIAAGNAINADGNCHLTLVGVNVTAPVGINASGNAKITVTGGSIKGSTSAIVAAGNSQVTVSGATVTGKTSATDNGKITGVGGK
jgi:hypothetical protein